MHYFYKAFKNNKKKKKKKKSMYEVCSLANQNSFYSLNLVYNEKWHQDQGYFLGIKVAHAKEHK